ncbi:MAG TPA: DUF4922 domain-containing protein [Gammaproteobacteria bacterium]|nr:DUF4922 domain-containing protein [Gammaproteobacteria bacterium]
MPTSELNREQYSEIWTDLNRRLKHIEQHEGGLAGALEALKIQQLERGFIKDDLHEMRRYRFPHPNDPERFFLVQYNPVRALRFSGSGRRKPPHGSADKYDGCFLCPDNVEWQQAGLEMGYELEVDAMRYVAWMNAYPLMPLHCVIASREHIPQAWCVNGEAIECLSIEKILNDLVTLSSRAPGFVGFYNGKGAGASIPGHFHFQFFKRPELWPQFPLEVAARESGIETHGTIENYPLAVEYWRGDPNAVVEAVYPWIRNWLSRHSHQRLSISANIVSTFDQAQQQSELYFVPRHESRVKSPEMSGTIGGIEVLGEMVFSGEEDARRLQRGEVDYHAVERILSAARFD